MLATRDCTRPGDSKLRAAAIDCPESAAKNWLSRMISIVTLVSALVSFIAIAQARGLTSCGSTSASRLPASVVPNKYQLQLEPDLRTCTFKGTETITLDLLKPASTISLNAAELILDRAQIVPVEPAKTDRLAGAISLDSKLEQATISFSRTLKPGRYKLTISFKGTLNNKLRGFYRSYYADTRGARHSLAVTQMEPTDARRTFPCFDEPAFKASFEITAVIDPELTAISNAPVVGRTADARRHKQVVVFAATPKMSTYLVALLVGPFEATEARTVAGVPIRVWTVRGKAGMGRYAQQVAGQLLTYYNAYFGIPYPARKLDLVAIPDFEAGAMENLGAITFRESLLLVEQKSTATETLQSVSAVVAHEMAHMWFGDLVTMSWWDDVWLNEAFASWMATKAVDHLMPQWHFWDQFGLSRVEAMATDSLRSTRAIHFAVKNPDQANEMFDSITYAKGASILRMLEKYVGEPLFQRGVHDYLLRHQFANATTDDLWQAIGAASTKPIQQMMKGWVYQPGMPLITVEQSAGDTAFQQRRFLLDHSVNMHSTTTLENGKSSEKPDKEPIWPVPLGIRVVASAVPEEATHETRLLTSRRASFAVGKPGSAMIANAGASGYYRVRYPGPLLKALLPLIQTRLSVAERLQLLDDQWALAVAGQVPIESYLELTATYKLETDPSVIEVLAGQLHQLERLVDSKAHPAFERFLRDRLGPAKARLGWTAGRGESDLSRMSRRLVLETLGTIGHDTQTVAEARRLFGEYLRQPSSVDPNLLDPITEIVAYNGDSNSYMKIKQLWLEAETPEIEQRNLMALGKFQEPALIRQALELCLDDDVRTQDAPHLLSVLINNNAGKRAAWQFLKKNWDAVLERYPQNMVPHVVAATSSLNTAADEADLRAFFKSHPVPAGERALARTLERVHISVNFRARSGKPLNEWLLRPLKLPGAIKD